jgi:hypothetical protein
MIVHLFSVAKLIIGSIMNKAETWEQFLNDRFLQLETNWIKRTEHLARKAPAGAFLLVELKDL